MEERLAIPQKRSRHKKSYLGFQFLFYLRLFSLVVFYLQFYKLTKYFVIKEYFSPINSSSIFFEMADKIEDKSQRVLSMTKHKIKV